MCKNVALFALHDTICNGDVSQMTTCFARKYKIYKATLPLGRLECATGNLTWQHDDCTTCSHTRTYTHTRSLTHAQHGVSSFSPVRTKNKTSHDGCRRVFTVCSGSHILFYLFVPEMARLRISSHFKKCDRYQKAFGNGRYGRSKEA